MRNFFRICLDKRARTGSGCPLCFMPVEPRLELGLDTVWMKHRLFSHAAATFLESQREEIARKYPLTGGKQAT